MSTLETTSSYFKGDTIKKVAMAGFSGGLFVFTSDFFLDRYFKDEAGADKENAELMRAGAQAIGGLALAGLVSRWSKMAAMGIAVGAILGAARHLFVEWDLTNKLDEWFPEDGTPTTTPETPARGISYMGRRSY